jgi:ammonia channel protein AmtB
MMYAIHGAKLLRVPADIELEGIDIHEHGGSAYHPEFAFTGTGVPASSGARKEA